VTRRCLNMFAKRLKSHLLASVRVINSGPSNDCIIIITTTTIAVIIIIIKMYEPQPLAVRYMGWPHRLASQAYG